MRADIGEYSAENLRGQSFCRIVARGRIRRGQRRGSAGRFATVATERARRAESSLFLVLLPRTLLGMRRQTIFLEQAHCCYDDKSMLSRRAVRYEGEDKSRESGSHIMSQVAGPIQTDKAWLAIQ